MTTERNIIIHAGQTFELSLDYAGTPGRGQRMHIRASDAAADVIAILTHNGDANARVIYDGTDSLDITIGASVNGGWLVGANRVEWVYDIEDYDLSDTDDVVIAYRGKAIVYGNRTRPEDVTPSAALPSGDGRYVRFDGVQGLTDAQKLQARENIGAGTGGGGGSGDVVGPAGATDDRIAAFDGVTGKLIKQGTVTATAVASHLSSTSNPHSTTAAQVGADPAGTAASAVSTHAGAADPHGDRAFATSAVSTHNAVTTAHGISAFGASLVDDADASAARTTLGLGTAATAATGDFATASHTHAASDVTSGTFDAARLPAASETALGAVELATTAEALTGTDTARAVTPAGVKAVADTKAASSHTHAASDITSGTLDAARLPLPTTTTIGGIKRNTGSAGQYVTGVDASGNITYDTPAGGSPGGSDTQVQFNDGGSLAGDSGFTFNKTNNTVDLGGATVTASDPVMDLSQTWNGAGVAFTGWKLNVTDTASAAASILGDWQIGGNSRIRFGKNSLSVSGTDQSTTFLKMTHAGGSTATIDYKGLDGNTSRIYTEGAGTWLFDNGSNLGGLYILGATGTRVNSTAYFGWTNSNAYNGTLDLAIYRDAANTLAQRNGTNAQTFRVYRSYTDGSNYSRWTVKWNTSTAILHAEGAGTGTDGSVAFNDAALATDATRGFLMIPSCAGTPTGTPADIPTGQAPIVYDSTNKKLCVWDGAAWVQTAALT